MIWATDSSWSCFCRLYRASSLAAKNIISLTLVLTIWWCPCAESSLLCLVGRGCFLGKTLLAFALLHSVLQGQICVLLLVILDSYFCIPVPYNENDTFWGCFIKALAGLHRTVQLQLLWYYWSWHRLGLLWYWMVCLGNKQRSYCHFWDCIQVLHFRIFCWLWCLLQFF